MSCGLSSQSKTPTMETKFQPTKEGYYGQFGGAFIPELLHPNVKELEDNYLQIIYSDAFQKEYKYLLDEYVGRPTPLYLAKHLSEKFQASIYLKREDLCHTGAHKINNTIGQILLAKHLGKKTHHSRDRGWTTRSCHCDGLCFDEFGVHCFYGRSRYQAPGSQCGSYENVGRDGHAC